MSKNQKQIKKISTGWNIFFNQPTKVFNSLEEYRQEVIRYLTELEIYLKTKPKPGEQIENITFYSCLPYDVRLNLTREETEQEFQKRLIANEKRKKSRVANLLREKQLLLRRQEAKLNKIQKELAMLTKNTQLVTTETIEI